MKKLQLIQPLLVAFHFLKAASQGWLSIDCGAEHPRLSNNLIVWESDGNFIQTGVNEKVQKKQELEEMNTLRSFDNRSEEHCYKLPVYKLTLRYIIHAGFFYGNYDRLSRSPTFSLTVDGKKWTTVNTSPVDGSPLYNEISYVTHGLRDIKVCLVQISKGGVPFISSLEAVPMWVNLFPNLKTNATIHLVSRTNFDGPEVRFTSGLHGDMFNRMWTRGATPPNCREVSTMPADTTLEIRNRPPLAAVGDSVESFSTSDPIILLIPLPPLNPQVACFAFYFSYLSYHEGNSTNGSRITQIYINGQEMDDPVTFKTCSCKVVNFQTSY